MTACHERGGLLNTFSMSETLKNCERRWRLFSPSRSCTHIKDCPALLRFSSSFSPSFFFPLLFSLLPSLLLPLPLLPLSPPLPFSPSSFSLLLPSLSLLFFHFLLFLLFFLVTWFRIRVEQWTHDFMIGFSSWSRQDWPNTIINTIWSIINKELPFQLQVTTK